jgi:hypothetical protein
MLLLSFIEDINSQLTGLFILSIEDQLCFTNNKSTVVKIAFYHMKFWKK